jgi:hypothetical protein
VIDGFITPGDPWADFWIPIDKRASISTTNNIMGKFQMCFDEKNLYILTHVTDPTLDTTSYTVYCNDYIQVFIKMDTTSTSGEYSFGDWYIFQKRASTFPDGFTPWSQYGYHQFLDSAFRIVQSNSIDEYIQEWQLPWEYLYTGLEQGRTEDYFKFEISCADGNELDCRTQLMFWNSDTDEQWHNTNYFGLIKLGTPPIEIVGNEKTISCGEELQLILNTNFEGDESAAISWYPSAGLSRDDIKNPVVNITADMTYYVTVTTLNQEIYTDSVAIKVVPLSLPSTICLVTVNENHKNVIVWEKSFTEGIDSFRIFRESLTQSNVYDLIGSVSSGSELVFTDESSNALIQGNKYRIAAMDECGNEGEKSPAHKTIHLNINQGLNNSWNLNWDDYEGFTVQSYKILRGSVQSELVQIGSTSGSFNTYTDFTAPEGDVFYQVEVISPYICTTHKSTTYNSSRSNIASNAEIAVHEKFRNNPANIYPNPTYDMIYTDRLPSGVRSLDILSVQGRVLMQVRDLTKEKSIDISLLPEGIYYIRWQEGDHYVYLKFVKLSQ